MGHLSADDVDLGNVLEIGLSESNRFKPTNFQRTNFKIKGGGINDYQPVKGSKVVTSTKEKRTVAAFSEAIP